MLVQSSFFTYKHAGQQCKKFRLCLGIDDAIPKAQAGIALMYMTKVQIKIDLARFEG
jgi:hypothetical protein